MQLYVTAPEYLFINNEPYFEVPDHSTLIKKGEFVLQDLHSITPYFCREENFIDEDGNLTISNNYVKYLGIYIDNFLNFFYHINVVR